MNESCATKQSKLIFDRKLLLHKQTKILGIESTISSLVGHLGFFIFFRKMKMKLVKGKNVYLCLFKRKCSRVLRPLEVILKITPTSSEQPSRFNAQKSQQIHKT